MLLGVPITWLFMEATSTVVTGLTNSLVYKLVNVSGATSGTTQTLTLDRATPTLTGLTGNANVVCNKCENEFESRQI